MFIGELFKKPSMAFIGLLLVQPGFAASTLIDSVAVEYGSADKFQLVRFSVQSDWDRSWFETNGFHLSGYWDANLAQWRGDAYQDQDGKHQNITVVNLTPVFRIEGTDSKGWYCEVGVGVSLLSDSYDNNGDRLSTHFQFCEHFGIGYVFDGNWELGAKIQHYSNGGIKKPNSGVTLLALKAAYHF